MRVRGTTFLVAAVKTAVILFMWAEFPFNQFMKIKVSGADPPPPSTALPVGARQTESSRIHAQRASVCFSSWHPFAGLLRP